MSKILLITCYFPPNIGGGEEYLYNIYKRLPSDSVIVLAHSDLSADKANEAKFDRQQNFKIYRANFFSGSFKPAWWPMVKLVKKIIKQENIEIVHFGHYAHCQVIARLIKKPYLTFVQGTDFFSYTGSSFGRWLSRFNLKGAKKIIANSQFLKNQLEKLGADSSKIEILTPGINLKDFDLDAQPLLEFQNKKIILSVGRLVRLKGFDLIISAMPEILKEIPSAIYVVVGDGPEKENLQKLALDLRLQNKIIFTGKILDKKELSKYYASAAVYAGPSRTEGFGIVFLETRAFGLPIIAANIGGIPEAVENRGILIESENIKSFSQDIIEALKKDEKYEPDINFDWDEKVDQIKKIQKLNE